MILVLLGTQNNSFIRLLDKIEELVKKEIIKEEVIVQSGYTKKDDIDNKIKLIDFMSLSELDKLASEARYIITHGGVGSIIMALKLNKKVIAIPRLSKYKEHVNDHQKDIVEVFNKKEHIIGIDQVELLEDAVKNIESFKPQKYKANNNKMINIIEEFIGE